MSNNYVMAPMLVLCALRRNAYKLILPTKTLTVLKMVQTRRSSALSDNSEPPLKKVKVSAGSLGMARSLDL